MTLQGFGEALWFTYKDISRKHTFQMAAALSYYFVISLFPALILFAAIVTHFRVHDLMNQTFDLMGGFVPKETLNVVEKALSSAVSPHRSTFLSFGILGTLWTASSGFSAIIEALNIAYEVEETRPFWKTRPRVVGLTVVIGLLLLIDLGVMIAGPDFGRWFAERLHLSGLFAMVWPFVRWTIAVGFAVLSVECVYFLAPNIEQRLVSTLPGAILSVACWIALSYGLSVYFRSFTKFDKTYGSLGAVVASMIWLYWTGYSMLLGAELNCRLAKESRKGAVAEAVHPRTKGSEKRAA
jgi:membrane protein